MLLELNVQNTDTSLVLEILPCLLMKAEEYCQILKQITI